MTTSHSALFAIVQARPEDDALRCVLAAAARHHLGDAEARAHAMRSEARQLRHAARRNLHAAKSKIETAGQWLRAIGALQLEDGVKDAALRAARKDLSLRRSALRGAAEELEAAVARAQALEAQADETLSAARRRPEVVAWEAMKCVSENGRAAPCPSSRGSGPLTSVGVTESHDG